MSAVRKMRTAIAMLAIFAGGLGAVAGTALLIYSLVFDKNPDGAAIGVFLGIIVLVVAVPVLLIGLLLRAKTGHVALGAILVVFVVAVLVPFAWRFLRVEDGYEREHEIHLIPQGFVGPVVIVLNQRDGELPTREGDARLYRIPLSGVLKTQWGFNNRGGLPEWYYVDSAGNRTRILGGPQCGDTLPLTAPRACWFGFKGLVDRAPIAVYLAYMVSHGPASSELWRRTDSLVEAVIFPTP